MSPSPRFRILLTNSSSMYGGGEFYVWQLADALRAHGHAVWVSCRPDNVLFEKCSAAHIPVFPLDFPPQGQFPRFIRQLTTFVRSQGVQIVHSNANYDRTASAFAARIVRCSHVTNVHSFHSIEHNVTHWIRNRFATDHYLVDGYCVKELLERDNGIPSERISVVYLGVQLSSMKREERHRQKVREEFRLDKGDIVIGNVARLVPFKGHSFLLNAFARIAPRFPSARLLIVGDGELEAELRMLAENLSITGQTVFAGFRHDLQAVYSALDIYAHSSVEGGGETFPFAVLQALAQELPVVVTRVGDVHAMVDEGRNGFVVPDRNPEALAGRLADLILDQGTRRRMGSESLRVAQERFTLERMVGNVEQVYRSVLDKRTTSGL